MRMDLSTVREWLLDWGSRCIAEKDYLSDLDNEIGDGDHGFNMAKAFEVYQTQVVNKALTSLADEFKTLAMTLMSKVGGTAGPIYGSAFLAMSKAGGSETELTHELFVTLVEAALVAIQNRGKAQVGEKTLVDVWAPVLDCLKNNTLTAEQIDAAEDATIPMEATKGRASYLGPRSVGHKDPGSHSSGLFFKAYLEHVNEVK